MILPMPLRDEDMAFLSIHLMDILAKYPVYVTRMHKLGIFDLLQRTPQCEKKKIDAYTPRCSADSRVCAMTVL